MRFESILLHLIVAAALSLVWFFARGLCCCNDGMLKDVCDLATVGGISSFAEISFALNTSIAIKWVRSQFMAYFDGFAERRIIEYKVKSKKNTKISDTSADECERQKALLKRRFDSMMLWPTRIYASVGVSFAVAIAAMLFSGIPVGLKPFIVIFPFPAIAYYLTAFLAAGFIFIHFDSFMHDKELPFEEDTENATSDVATVVRGASAKKKTAVGRKNGNGKKATPTK